MLVGRELEGHHLGRVEPFDRLEGHRAHLVPGALQEPVRIERLGEARALEEAEGDAPGLSRAWIT